MRLPKHRLPTSPGEMLKEEFMVSLKINENELARRSNLSVSDIKEIISGKRKIDVGVAGKLARVFQTSVHFWMNLQNNYDEALKTRK